MSIRNVLYSVPIVLFLTSTPAYSADFENEKSTPSSNCLNVQSAIAQTLRQDPRIERARAQRDIAAANLKAVKSETGPQISSFAQLGNGDGELLNRRTDNQTGIQFTKEIYDFGASHFSKKAARASLDASQFSIDLSTITSISDAGAAFLETSRSRELLEIAEQREAYYEDDNKTVDERLANKVITVSDASQIKASYTLAISQRVTAKLDVEKALHRLERISGQQISCIDKKSIHAFFTPLRAEIDPLAVDELLEAAMQNSPDLKEAVANVEASKAALKSAKRSNLPEISVSGFKSYEYVDELDDWIEEDRIGINIVSDLYNAGRGSAVKEDARARIRRANSDLESARQSVKETVLRNAAQLNAQLAAADALADAKHHLERQLMTTEREYKIRTRTLSDVIRAAESYFDTATKEANTRHQAFNTMLILRVTTNPFDIDDYGKSEAKEPLPSEQNTP